jgi:hypothetical protein
LGGGALALRWEATRWSDTDRTMVPSASAWTREVAWAGEGGWRRRRRRREVVVARRGE